MNLLRTMIKSKEEKYVPKKRYPGSKYRFDQIEVGETKELRPQPIEFYKALCNLRSACTNEKRIFGTEWVVTHDSGVIYYKREK